MEAGNVAIALRRVEVGFQNSTESNQFEQISDLGQHEKSRRGICSRDSLCDHIPKAVY